MKHLLILWLAMTACSTQQTVPSVPVSTPTPEPVKVAISLSQVIDAFKLAGLPVTRTVVYNERSDPNGLLGRPNRYVEKMNFTDGRLKGRELNCSIEVFTNKEDAQARKDYIHSIGKAASPLDFYYYLNHNVLVRIDLKLTPSEAAEYQNALSTLP